MQRGQEKIKMKIRILVGICLIVIFAAAHLLPGETQKTTGNGSQDAVTSGTAQNGHSGHRIAPASFPVGKEPYGVAFDGTSIWVANFRNDTVSKLRANDGVVLGTFNVGRGPIGVVSDGS